MDDPKTMLTINFGAEGNSADFVAGGWSVSERRLRWMTGTESELRIEPGLIGGDHIMELDLHPFARPPKVPSQRLTVAVNGTLIGGSTIANGGRFGYRIPAAVLADRASTSIKFTHPDAARPCDSGPSNDRRLLSLSIMRMRISPVRQGASQRFLVGKVGIGLKDLGQAVGMDPARFILNFESLGNNCEFGLVQRICGAEAFLSLLRFAGMELPTLLRALDAGMQDFGDAAHVEIRVDDKERPEFVVHETHYGVFFHTFRYADETQADRLHASESKRLAYCARRFIGDLQKGSKILVVKRNEPLQEHEILPLYAALSAYGPNVLLWVVPADARHTPGSVETVLPGLLRGYIGRFAPYENAPDLLLDEWLEVCVNAYRLAREDGMGASRDVGALGRRADTLAQTL
jgi:hypothetical protein